MRFSANDFDGARQAWEQSLQCSSTVWAMRNLAVLALEEGRVNEAVSMYIEAVHMKPELRSLAIECGQVMLQSGQPQNWLDLMTE